jgi:hypothetical protein
MPEGGKKLIIPQTQSSSHREVLVQASSGISRLQSEIESLKLQIRDQAALIRDEKNLRQAAESIVTGSKAQQSQLARDKNELEVKLRNARAESGKVGELEVGNRKLGEVVKNLTISNESLRVSRVCWWISVLENHGDSMVQS